MNVSTSRVVAIFGHKSCFHWISPVKNGLVYFACSCDLARVLATFGHKSCFHWFLPVEMDVSTSRVVATLRV